LPAGGPSPIRHPCRPIGTYLRGWVSREESVTGFATTVNACIKYSPAGTRILCTSAQPKTPPARLRSGLHGVIDSLLSAQHILEMFHRTLPEPALAASRLVSSNSALGTPESGQRMAGLADKPFWISEDALRPSRPRTPRRCRSISTTLETALSPRPSIAHCREAVLIMVVVCLAGANNESAPSKCSCLDRGSRP
jgi:hypothetical protein